MTAKARFEILVTREPRWVRQAQRLRYLVFADELGAKLPPTGFDEDRFDAHCDHMIVRDREADQVVGTYRILPPKGAEHVGRYHAEHLFDLTLLHPLRSRMVEMGRACIDAEYRSGTVMLHLWTALARYLIEQRLDFVIGSASISVADGGHAAASIYRAALARSESPEDLRVFPVRRLAIDRLRDTLPLQPPPLLKAYLNLGAWVCGEPAYDSDFGCADVPVLLPLARMHSRYTRHFLAQAA
ncbi:hypothetical protein BWI17_10545 [Betaproteobacteria bacterium GR16-43]|nr:hypothetical protein BWI17_10545 [Betaproteobacteria bacterium GR16-43]